MNLRLANFISIILHPLLMPTYLFFILFLFAPAMAGVEAFGLNFRFYLLGFLFLYTFVLPGISVYWLQRIGVIESLKMEKRTDRPFPMFLTATIYIGMAYFLYTKNPLLGQLGMLLFDIALVIIAVGIISFFWQISAHAAGIAGLVGIMMHGLIFDGEEWLFYSILLFLILTSIVVSARLQLNAHTPKQTFFGLIIGFFIGFCTLIFL